MLTTLKQGIKCDFERLQDLADCHGTVGETLGHSGLDDTTRYEHRALLRNVSLVRPELLGKIDEPVVKAGHALFGQEPETFRVACADSLVVGTEVRYPSDLRLLWDAMRRRIRLSARLASGLAAGGISAGT